MSISKRKLRKLLKNGCSSSLIPHLNKHGFFQVEQRMDQPETKPNAIFPFGKIERRKDSHLELVEIQFDKYGDPAMRISFGKVPKSGVISPRGIFVKMDDAILCNLPVYYSLYSSRHRMRWFKPGILAPKTERSIERLLAHIIDVSNEMLVWFDTEKIGKHIRTVDQQKLME